MAMGASTARKELTKVSGLGCIGGGAMVESGVIDDTSPAAKSRYFELLRNAGPRRRLEICAELTRATRELAIAGIRAVHRGEHLSDAKLRELLAERLYGREVAGKYFRASDG